MKKVNYVLRRSYLHYLFAFSLIILPLTLKAHPHFPKVKVPGYEQVAPYYFGLREHEAKPQTIDADDKINVNNVTNKTEVKGDSLVKEWERTYDYGDKYIINGLSKDSDNNILVGMTDGVTYSHVVKVNPVNGDTITVITRGRNPPGSEEGDSGVEQVLSGKDNRQIMVGMDWNYAENRNNLWVGSYSENGDSLFFKFYNRDSTSSDIFFLQEPSGVLSNGDVVSFAKSNYMSGAYNVWGFCVDTLGNIKWAYDFVDTTVEKSSGTFNDVGIRSDTIWAAGTYTISSQNFGPKLYVIDKDGNVINKKYYDLDQLSEDNVEDIAFSPDGRLYIAGDFDGSDGYWYDTPFVAELNPQTLDTLWLKTYEGGVYRDERVEDMTVAGGYVFLAGWVNADTDTAAIWMVDTAGNYVGEFDRPNAIYTGATSIGDSLVFAYGRDQGTSTPLLVKYKLDKSGINEEREPANKPNGLEWKVLNNPSPAPVVKVIASPKFNPELKIDIYDITGREVRSYHLNGGEAKIDGLKSGVYLIRYGKNKEKIVVMK